MPCTGDAGVAGVGAGIQQLRLDGAGRGQLRGRASRRRGALYYVGLDTRPAHVENKQGDVNRCDAIDVFFLLFFCSLGLT